MRKGMEKHLIAANIVKMIEPGVVKTFDTSKQSYDNWGINTTKGLLTHGQLEDAIVQMLKDV
jgi:hypothetical protein